MYKTKTAWKVVSDPYAPESRWVPAFAEVCGAEGPDYEMHASGAQKPKTTSRKVSEAVALSVVAGLLGGAFAGQCVHLTYFAHHLFEQVVFNHFYFEPWGAFYFWYNQNNSAFVYIPLFFSYSMGFWASIHNLGKGFNALNFGILALYILTMSGLHQYVPFISEQQYFSTLLGAGMAGSIIAFFLGKTIAKNISAVINPRLIFLSLFFVFIPAMCPILPSMGRFDVIATAYVVAVFGIGCAIRCMHNGSLKTSILLSLTAASPLVLCGLMHIPAANHFRNVLSDSYGAAALFFYYALLPGLALALPVIGTVVAHWQKCAGALTRVCAVVNDECDSSMQNFSMQTTGEAIYPTPAAQSSEEP